MLQHRVGLPYPPSLREVIRRSVWMWLLVRILSIAVIVAAAAFLDILPPGEAVAAALHPVWAIRAGLVALAAVLVWIDRTRFHELLLPANLGVWPGWFWIASLLAAGVMDVAVQTLLAAF